MTARAAPGGSCPGGCDNYAAFRSRRDHAEITIPSRAKPLGGIYAVANRLNPEKEI